MKTALTELIEELQSLSNNRHVKGIHVQAIMKAKCLLEKEKQQIMDAYEQGYSDRDIEEYECRVYKDSEQYFNQTFLSNENTK